MIRIFFPLLMAIAVLSGCATAQPKPEQAQPQAVSPFKETPVSTEPVANPAIMVTPTTDPAVYATLFPNANSGDLARRDEQGMVVFEVAPLNLGAPGDSLDFDVVMDTHSVDLSMDLAQVATLITDTGTVVQATFWDAPRGGHHVAGRLVFPSSKDGVSILAGVTKLVLQIRDVDAPMRTFEWELK